MSRITLDAGRHFLSKDQSSGLFQKHFLTITALCQDVFLSFSSSNFDEPTFRRPKTAYIANNDVFS